MTTRSIRHERRGPDRPVAGDWKPCPICTAGMLLFTEQYHGRHDLANTRKPAWVCDKCPKVVYVRAEHQPTAVIERARNVRAKAGRTVMRSTFAQKRAHRVLKQIKSQKQQD